MTPWDANGMDRQQGSAIGDEVGSRPEASKTKAETTVEYGVVTKGKPEESLYAAPLSPYAPPTSALAPTVDWSGHSPSGPQKRPWARYWARTLDNLLFGLLFGGLLTWSFPKFGEMNDQLFGMILLLIYNFFEPIMLSILGTTPFKALLRIRVRNSDGSKLGYAGGLRRTFGVYLRGQGLGIPLVSLFTQITAHSRLVNHGVTPWDQSGNYTVTHQTIAWWRWLILVATLLGFIALISYGGE